VIELMSAAQRPIGGYAGMTTASHLPPIPDGPPRLGPLVICDDCTLPPGTRFPMHRHHDDETISYVRSGTLYGKDDGGTELVLSPGSVGVMTAGRGMSHEEWVPADGEPVRMYHIALWPREAGLEPRYLSRDPEAPRANALRLVVSGDGREDSLPISQDVDVYDARLEPGGEIRHPLAPDRIAWLSVARGSVRIDGAQLGEGDSATLREAEAVELAGVSDSELLLFDIDPDAPAYREGTRFGGG
jgi:quercetin 2,3-dioxygenase